MSRIGINALGLKSGTGGVETYAYNLLRSLLETDNENEYFLFIGKNTECIFEDLKKFLSLKVIAYPIDTNNSTIRIIIENTLLAADLIKYKIPLVHHMCNYIPYISPVKSIASLMDTVAYFYHENYPEYTNMQKFYNYYKKAMSFTAKKAAKIVSISEFSKREFIKYFNVPSDKIVALPLASDTRKIEKIIDKNVINNLNISEPYILGVSVIRPHKNLDFLVKSYNLLKDKYNIPHSLVIAGGIHFGAEKFLEEINNSPYKSQIKYLGYVKEDTLASIYNFTDLFVFPSLYEGFGIPLLEAMEYKVPVLSSNAASLPEVGGDACLYFDPHNIEDCCEKMYSILNNEKLKQGIINKQCEQLKAFNWNKLSANLKLIYEEIING